MALVAHIDDSGSEPTSSHFVLSGYVHRYEVWAQFSDEWNAARKADRPISYLKGSEVWDFKKGEFEHFSKEDRREKIETFTSLIERYSPLGLSVSVKWEEFREFSSTVPLQKPAKNPYFFLFYSIIGLMLRVSHDYSQIEPADFIFDDQNGTGRLVRDWWPIFRERANPSIGALLDVEPLFRSEKDVLPLQAADLFAWYARRHTMGSLGDSWHVGIWERLRQTSFGAELSHKELWHIADDLGVIDDNKLDESRLKDDDGGAR